MCSFEWIFCGWVDKLVDGLTRCRAQFAHPEELRYARAAYSFLGHVTSEVITAPPLLLIYFNVFAHRYVFMQNGHIDKDGGIWRFCG